MNFKQFEDSVKSSVATSSRPMFLDVSTLSWVFKNIQNMNDGTAEEVIHEIWTFVLEAYSELP